MFNLFKNNSSDEVSFDEIKEACEQTGNRDLLNEPYFKEYMDLMMKGFEDPSEITFICSAVIIALAHYHGLPKHLFKQMLNDMEKSFEEAPSNELMETMVKYDML